jgi:hypothetical protein
MVRVAAPLFNCRAWLLGAWEEIRTRLGGLTKKYGQAISLVRKPQVFRSTSVGDLKAVGFREKSTNIKMPGGNL